DDPDDLPANLQLGEIYLVIGQKDQSYFQEAQEMARKVLEKEPENIPALMLLGKAAAGLQDSVLFFETIDRVLSLDPDHIPAFLILGTFHTVQGNTPEAERAFLKAREIDPKNKSTLLTLADFYYLALGDLEKAEKSAQEAFWLDPTDREVYLPLARFYVKLGRFESAEKMLQEAQEKSPHSPDPTLTLVDLYQAQGHSREARKLLRDLKEKFPDSVAISKKVSVLFMKSDPEWVRSEIEGILESDPKDLDGLVLLGQLQFFSGQYQQAEETLKEALLRTDTHPEAHFFLGRIAALKGKLNQAQQEYQKALSIRQNYRAVRVALAEVYLRRERFSDARAELSQILDAHPTHFESRLLQSRLEVGESNLIAAESLLTALLQERPADPVLHHQMGVCYQKLGLTSGAEKHLVKALQLDPESRLFLNELVQFYIAQEESDRALETIMNTIPGGERKAFHHELMGEIYFKAGELSEAERAYRQAVQMQPDHVNSHVLLAGVYLQSGRLDEALKQLDELLEAKPGLATAHGLKGLVYKVRGQIEEAKREYISALDLDPQNASLAHSLASLLAEEDDNLAVALRWASTARRLNPQDPKMADTLGWIYNKMGIYRMAEAQLSFAMKREPDNPTFQYHLAVVYKNTDRIQESRNSLKLALNSGTEFKERALTEAALRELD
ncbi:MAG: tetratricopeptide repeat protein, partial [Acidobacteriota bacterium]